MATTLKDIADRSGVSIKTVSRVLNKEPNVSPATRERVEEAATELGYRPNLAAKGLASSRSFFVAVLYDTVSASYVLSLMQGATRACRDAGYHLVVQPAASQDLDSETAVAGLLRNLHVDGVILTPPLCDNPHLLHGLTRLNMPCVRVSPADESGPHTVLRIDNRGAARNLTQRLIGQGHRRIGLVTGIAGHAATDARLHGYREALDAAAIAFEPELVVEGDFTWRSGRAACAQLMGVANAPTAIFASNDDMAAGVIKWLGEHGRKCPDHVAVAGFDDTPLSRLLHPALTTVGQDVEGMGALAVELLTSADARRERVHDFDLTLIPRASTGDHPHMIQPGTN